MSRSVGSTWLQVSVRGGPETAIDDAPLLVSGLVPLADLLPGLIEALGPARPEDWDSGLSVRVSGGQALAWGMSLLDQDVGDGAVLVIAVPPAPLRHDDVTEALAAEVRAGARTSDHGRQVAACVACAVVLCGALTLLHHGPDVVSAITLAGVSLLVGIAASAARAIPGTGTALAFTTTCVFGLALAEWPGVAEHPTLRAVAGGVGVALAGAVWCRWLPEVAVAALATGGALAGGAAVVHRGLLSPHEVACVLVPLAAGVGQVVPRWVTARTCGGRSSLSPTDGDWDPRWLAARARRGLAAALWRGWAAAAAAIVVTGTWWLALGGIAGVCLALCCAGTAWFAARHTVQPAVRGWARGAVLGVTAVVTWQGMRTDAVWSGGWAVGLVVAGALLATRDLAPSHQPQRLEHWLDLLENLLVAAVVPLALVASGVLGLSGGWPGSVK